MLKNELNELYRKNMERYKLFENLINASKIKKLCYN